MERLTADRDTSTLWNMNEVSERMSSSRLRPYSGKRTKLASLEESPAQHCVLLQSRLPAPGLASLLKQLPWRASTLHTVFQKLNSDKMVKVSLGCHYRGNRRSCSLTWEVEKPGAAILPLSRALSSPRFSVTQRTVTVDWHMERKTEQSF